MTSHKLTAALCLLLVAFTALAATTGNKISDYTETLSITDAWIYEIAVPGVTNYKVSFGTIATNIIARVPSAGDATNKVSNLRGVATNATFWGGATNQGTLYMVGPTLPSVSNTYDRGSFLLPDRSNWVNSVVVKDTISLTGPTNLTKVRIGTQGVPTETGRDVNAYGGFVEVNRGDGIGWARFQHYQYGIALRANSRLLEVMLDDTGTEIPTLAVTANGNSNGNPSHVLGTRVATRDKWDLSGWDLDASLMWTNGNARLMTSGTDMPGCQLIILNDFSDGGIQMWTGRGPDLAARTTVTSNGFFGLGITNPLARAHFILGDGVYEGANDLNAFWISGANTNKRIVFDYDTIGNFGIIQAVDAGNDFRPLALNRDGGNVGIVTSSPTNALDVNGHASIRSNFFLANLPTNGSPIAFLATDAAGAVYETAVPISGGGSSGITTNANQFGVSVQLAIKNGALTTNLVVAGVAFPDSILQLPQGTNLNVFYASNYFGGRVQIASGTPAAGDVLTSDAEGNASWEPPTGGGGSSLTTNANQFGASVQLTIKDGVVVTNLNVRGLLKIGGSASFSDAADYGGNPGELWTSIGGQFNVNFKPTEVLLRNAVGLGWASTTVDGALDTGLWRFGANTNVFGTSTSVGNGSIIASNAIFNGNVGIGTNAPAARLQVVADNSVLKGFRYGTTNRPDLVWADTNGTVGIASNLWVTGAVQVASLSSEILNVGLMNLTNALGSNQVRLGYQDLTNILRRQTIYADAGSMVSNSTEGATFSTEETSSPTNRMFDSFLFSGVITNSVQFKLAMPLNWDLSAMKVKLWTSSTNNIATTTNVWAISASAIKANSVITNIAWGTEVTITNAVSSAGGQALLTPATPSLTVGNSPASAGNLVWVRIRRLPGHVDDNDGGLQNLLGAWVQYGETMSEVASW